MLTVKKDERRNTDKGQYLIELTMYRDVSTCMDNDDNRLGYWCDKSHLGHLFAAFFKYFTIKEILQIWHDGYWKS